MHNIQLFSNQLSKSKNEFKLDNLTVSDSGIYQVDVRIKGYGIMTSAAYLQVFDGRSLLFYIQLKCEQVLLKFTSILRENRGKS